MSSASSPTRNRSCGSSAPFSWNRTTCMDHPRFARTLVRLRHDQRLLSCIRPCSAVNRPQALMIFADRLPDNWTSCSARVVSWAYVDPGPTGVPSTFRYPRKPDSRAAGVCSVTRRPPLIGKPHREIASPTRSWLSCAPGLSRRRGSVDAPAAAKATDASASWAV
jgi:hypothetical protein